MNFEWDIISEYYPILLKGAILALQYTVICIILSLILGLLVAILRVLKISKIVDGILNSYISIFREIPLLVILYFIFFGLSQIRLIMPASVAGILAITLNEGAFIAEIIRGGFESIHKEQWESAIALRMTKIQAIKYVILPQAIKKVIPSLVGQSSSILKDTAILAVIAIEELTFSSKIIFNATFNGLTSFGSVALLYVMLFLIINVIGIKLEKAFKNSN